MKKHLKVLYQKTFLIIITMTLFFSGCGSLQDTVTPISSADSFRPSAAEQSSSQSASDNSVVALDGVTWKTLTCTARLMRAAKNWFGAEFDPNSEDNHFLTYSIDYPDSWVLDNDKCNSSYLPEQHNGVHAIYKNAKIAEIFPFYIPDGMIVPDNYFELAFMDQEFDPPSFPNKISDITVGNLTGEMAYQTGDNGYYVYYLTDGKTMINIMFYNTEKTKDYLSDEIMKRVVGSVKFLE